MRLKTIWMRVIALTVIIAAPKNDEKGLHRFGIFWSHLPQYQKGGVRTVLLITLSCCMGNYEHLYNILYHIKY